VGGLMAAHFHLWLAATLSAVGQKQTSRDAIGMPESGHSGYLGRIANID